MSGADVIQDAIYNLSLLDDICMQMNTYQTRLMKHIYNTYLDGKTKDTYNDFNKKILKRNREMFNLSHDETDSNSDNELEDEKRCTFIIWNKGNMRRCKAPRYKVDDKCKRHMNRDSIFDSASSSSSESGSEADSEADSESDESSASSSTES